MYHSCTICGKPILSGGNFKTHMKNIHGTRDHPNPKLNQIAVAVISVEKDFNNLRGSSKCQKRLVKQGTSTRGVMIVCSSQRIDKCDGTCGV